MHSDLEDIVGNYYSDDEIVRPDGNFSRGNVFEAEAEVDEDMAEFLKQLYREELEQEHITWDHLVFFFQTGRTSF